MAFHNDFWVVVGTAAPVLALAHVVTISRAVRAFFSIPKQKRQSRENLGALAALAILGLGCCAAAFTQSMLALEWTRDAGRPVVSTALTIAAFALLTIQVVYEQNARMSDPDAYRALGSDE